MALALSPMSQVCRGLRAYLDGEINAPNRSKVTVVLASPADTAATGAGDAEHRVNLFFYRFEPGGLFPDTLPGQTGWLRAFCLVTPLAAEEDSVGAGENDLRLLGEVVRIFHEQPVLMLDVDGDPVHLQVMLQPLGLDQLNQLWSTQGDAIYRPSVLYEVSLVPVVPAVKAIDAPRVGGFGVEVLTGVARRPVAIVAEAPEVPLMRPALADAGWAPALAFVHDGACALSLSFALGSPALAAFVPRVWIAGQAGVPVTLRWETWDAAQGWQASGPGVAAVIADTVIDPAAVAGATTETLALPFDDHPGQMMLYAERVQLRASDGLALTVRSNVLLISLFAG